MKKFNLIELSINYENPNFLLIYISLKSGEERWFKGIHAIEDFLLFLSSPQVPKKIYFYITDPTFIFVAFSFNANKLDNLQYFAARTSIYYFSFNIGKKVVYFNNICQLIKINTDEYKALPYWQTALNDLTKLPLKYTLDPQFKSWENYDRLVNRYLQLWLDDSIKKPIVYNETTLLPSEVLNILQSNLKYLSNSLKTLDLTIRGLLIDWETKITISSIAKKIFERKFNSFNTQLTNFRDDDEKIRAAYYGGRCEVFGNHYESEETVFHFDYPNMYANIMTQDFPTGDLILKKNLLNFEEEGFYYVKVKAVSSLPVLPHKRVGQLSDEQVLIGMSRFNEINQNMIFSNGFFEGLYYKEEIDLFVKEGNQILSIEYAYIFSGISKPIFRDFAQNLIELRSKSEKDGKKIIKSLLVSFYGRLGMKPLDSLTKICNKKNYIKFKNENEILKESWLGDTCFAEVVSKSSYAESLVHYAAIITSRSRIKIFHSIREIEHNKGRILYLDTDGFFMAFANSVDLLSKEDGLIKWSEVACGKKIIDSVFASTRTYSIKYENSWETKIAGTERNSISFDSFKENFYTDVNVSYPSRFKVDRIMFDIFKHQEWKFESFISLHEYSKRKFSRDKKKSQVWYKLDETYIIVD